MESLVFSIVNTIVGAYPLDILPLDEYKDIKNNFDKIDDTTYLYVYKIVSVLQIYLAFPW